MTPLIGPPLLSVLTSAPQIFCVLVPKLPCLPLDLGWGGGRRQLGFRIVMINLEQYSHAVCVNVHGYSHFSPESSKCVIRLNSVFLPTFCFFSRSQFCCVFFKTFAVFETYKRFPPSRRINCLYPQNCNLYISLKFPLPEPPDHFAFHDGISDPNRNSNRGFFRKCPEWPRSHLSCGYLNLPTPFNLLAAIFLKNTFSSSPEMTNTDSMIYIGWDQLCF